MLFLSCFMQLFKYLFNFISGVIDAIFLHFLMPFLECLMLILDNFDALFPTIV